MGEFVNAPFPAPVKPSKGIHSTAIRAEEVLTRKAPVLESGFSHHTQHRKKKQFGLISLRLTEAPGKKDSRTASPVCLLEVGHKDQTFQFIPEKHSIRSSSLRKLKPMCKQLLLQNSMRSLSNARSPRIDQEEPKHHRSLSIGFSSQVKLKPVLKGAATKLTELEGKPAWKELVKKLKPTDYLGPASMKDAPSDQLQVRVISIIENQRFLSDLRTKHMTYVHLGKGKLKRLDPVSRLENEGAIYVKGRCPLKR